MILDKNLSLKELNEIHTVFIRHVRQTLLREIKVLVQMTVSIDQSNTKNFFSQMSQNENFLFYVLGDTENKNSVIMILTHELIYGLVDKLTGGPGKKSAIPKNKKELTKLEMVMLTKLCEEFKEHLELALKSHVTAQFQKTKFETQNDFLVDEVGTSQCLVLHHLLEFAEIKGELIVLYPDKRNVEHSLKLT